MLETLQEWAIWGAAVGAGVMAGVYFTFSVFVMRALAELPGAAGPAAMRAINRVILRSAFLPLFFATTLVSGALAVWALLDLSAPGAVATLAGGVVYVLGMFAVTVAFNVPRNERLDRAAPDSAEEAEIWALYLREWTVWNHVRTTACSLACGLFIAAVAAG